MRDQPIDRDEAIVVAHHEAGHAVVIYRAAGHPPTSVSIVPDAQAGSLGRMVDVLECDYTTEDAEANILSCYAGGHAQRRIAPQSGDEGCGQDDAVAAGLLVRCGYQHREQEWRDRSEALVGSHWAEIVAVATELLRTPTLEFDEVALIADVAAGVSGAEEGLAMYRAMARARRPATTLGSPGNNIGD